MPGPNSHSHRPIGALIAAATLLFAGCSQSGPEINGAPPDMRRLTEDQYSNIIRDVFGEGITIAGQLDPLIRTEGLLAIGARSARITPSGFEQYDHLATSIASQVVGVGNRDELVPCKPASLDAPDDSCAKEFLTKAGRLLYRRPLTETEIRTYVQAAAEAASGLHSFYDGLGIALAGMLTTPQFLFVIDTTEPDPDNPGAVRLTSYAKASRLSFLLWNSTPDDTLLAAAEKGELHTSRGLKRQVDRMIDSPRVKDGVRAFFKDMLHFEQFDTLEKDPTIYPAFSQRVAEDAMEQMLRTITDHLVNREEDYRDLFTTRRTFVSPALARIYQIPVERPDGGWTPYEFPPDDPRAGIVMQAGFTALHSHPGRSSPTLRGKALRETLLCQKVPDPPGDVDFTLFNDPNAPTKTARDRLTAHSTVPACAGCHKITDPIGLGLENFDGIGALRTVENGVELDVSGDLDGVGFTAPAGLAAALRDNPAVVSCVVNRLAGYAMGRPLTNDDRVYTDYLREEFADEGYKFTELLRRVALSDALYTVTKPAGPAAESDAVTVATR